MADYRHLAKLFAGRWIPGPKVEDGMRFASYLNTKGITTILNYLGEGYKEKKDMEHTYSVYKSILDGLKGSISYQISIKPTQIGIPDYPDLAGQYYDTLVEEASKNGIFVWVDMEESNTVDATIDLYMRNIDKPNTGLCIQSYLKRSFDDVKNLVEKGGKIRLVKGAYVEPESIAYRSREDTTRNFSKIMDYLFEHENYFMVATHDLNLVNEAIEKNKKYNRDFHIAMLNGIRNKEAHRLSLHGAKVALYVPFGEAWMSYAVRRLKETSNLRLVMRSLLQSQKI